MEKCKNKKKKVKKSECKKKLSGSTVFLASFPTQKNPLDGDPSKKDKNEKKMKKDLKLSNL